MEMCRFTGLDDIEFEKVAVALSRIAGTGFAQQQSPAEAPHLNNDQKQALLSSLKFDQINARHTSIKAAHRKTCRWLLEKSEYRDWLDIQKLPNHHGFLWIKGKPGTGKSTLMKFALANSRRFMKDTTVISFFFNARGTALEKSTIGMYRSLLVQILEQLPKLQDVFESVGFANWNINSDRNWSIESLKDLFQQTVQSLGQKVVMCFIDALDECDEDQIRDMVAFFQHLGAVSVPAGIRFQVCFSSRHYPHITISQGLSLVLEGQEGHDQDITNYVNSELRIGETTVAMKIKDNLREKSSGVFLWVVLVVDMLNKEHDAGQPARRLQQKLNKVPGDLHELFRDILTRDGCRDGEDLLLCIQWLLFARQPLKPEQLCFAILSGTEPEDVSAWDPDEITMDTMTKFILNSSKGLAEVTRSTIPTVRFILESVRDFFLKENGLGEVWSDLGTNFAGQSHDRLKQCCLRYMNVVKVCLNIGDQLPRAYSTEGASLRQRVSEQFPFLKYAVENVLWHAEAAQTAKVNQRDFISTFPLADWLKLHNVIERFHSRRHTPKTSFLYILEKNDLPALISIYGNIKHVFVLENERYGTPFSTTEALDRRHVEKHHRCHSGGRQFAQLLPLQSPVLPSGQISPRFTMTVQDIYHAKQQNTITTLPVYKYIKESLGKRQITILVDDCRYMRNYRREIYVTVAALLALTKDADRDGVEAYLVSDPMRPIESSSLRSTRSPEDCIIDRMDNVTNPGKCNMERALSVVLERTMTSADDFKPTTLVILTDGTWDEDNSPSGGAVTETFTAVRKLLAWGKNVHQLCMQFVRFGESEHSIQRLESLVDFLRDSDNELCNR